ncbi:MAG: exodeoxyribonuclease large subunit [Bacteroidota bacterium]|jgi:exodeoxyribonuclease VII large subunit
MTENVQIFSLKQVALSIEKTIASRYNQQYWVKAEIHKLNKYPSGHAFPELVEKEDGKIVAQLNGSIWKQHLQRIEKIFIDQVQEPLKDGIQVLMLVRVQFNPTFGLSLQIQDIDPAFTLGHLQKEKDITLKKLKAEGLLQTNQQLPYPLIAKRIAIISAATSKGLSDFYQVLDQNAFGYTFHTKLFEAYVQGDVAVASILEALQEIEKCQEQFDVVVLVRGGGAEVGLTCYNNYELCKGIATFPLPILTGIGHSTNLTVAELIAYASAITPTQLAEMLIAQFREFELRIERLSQGVVQHAQMQIQRNTDKINQVVQNLNWASNQYFKAKQLELEHALQKINLLDPIHILNRGFTITTIDGALLKNISDLENGQLMQTQTNEALIYSKIEKPNQN